MKKLPYGRVFLALAFVWLLVLAATLAPQQAHAQKGNDGDCDDLIDSGEGFTPDLLLQLGCIRDQTNNLTVIYQGEVIRKVVGARLAETVPLCSDEENRDDNQPPPDQRVCTQTSGLLITPVADIVAPAQPLWNSWVDGKVTWIDPGHDDLMPTEGTLFNGSAGIDYRFSDRIVLGLVGTAESSGMDTGGLFTGSTDAQALGGGAYAGITLADNLILNAMVTGAWVNTDNKYTGVAADIDSSRLQVSGGVTKYWYFGQTRFTPSAQISWSKEWQDSFVDSTSAFNPEQTLESAVATSSATIGHTLALANGQTIEPWVAGNLDWTIYSQIDTDGAAKIKLGQFLDLRVQAGVNWTIQQNVQLAATGEIGGLLHPDQDTYAGELNLAIQF